MPAHSSPWMQPTTRTLCGLAASPSRWALIGRSASECPTTACPWSATTRRGRRREQDLDAHGHVLRGPLPRRFTYPGVRTICLILLTSVGSRLRGTVRRSPVTGSRRREMDMRWRESDALGTPAAGRLVRGVQLPARAGFLHLGPAPAQKARPAGTGVGGPTISFACPTRRDATTRPPILWRHGWASATSAAPGGPFGPRHASHQNGLDVDVYYPRDRPSRAAAPRGCADRPPACPGPRRPVRRRRCRVLFVGPNTGLTGPAQIVQALWNHDNHLHARIAEDDRPDTIVVWPGTRSPRSSVRSVTSFAR